MQAQMMALMCTLPGTSMITETYLKTGICMSVSQRLGKIKIEGRSAIIEGVDRLQAQVKSTDLRAELPFAGRDVCRRRHGGIGHSPLTEDMKLMKIAILGANIKRLN